MVPAALGSADPRAPSLLLGPADPTSFPARSRFFPADVFTGV